MIIAIDFDGTCVTHDYPKVGKTIGAERVLLDLAREGHKLILWTMRSGKALDDAVAWFKRYNIPLWGINENPEKTSWTTSPKVLADYYIDDRAIGCPLDYSKAYSTRQYVDWDRMEMLLRARGLL